MALCIVAPGRRGVASSFPVRPPAPAGAPEIQEPA